MTSHALARRSTASLLATVVAAACFALLPGTATASPEPTATSTSSSARVSCSQLRDQRDTARSRRAAQANEVKQARFALDAERNRYRQDRTRANKERVERAQGRLKVERAELRQDTKVANDATTRYNRRCR